MYQFVSLLLRGLPVNGLGMELKGMKEKALRRYPVDKFGWNWRKYGRSCLVLDWLVSFVCLLLVGASWGNKHPYHVVIECARVQSVFRLDGGARQTIYLSRVFLTSGTFSVPSLTPRRLLRCLLGGVVWKERGAFFDFYSIGF